MSPPNERAPATATGTLTNTVTTPNSDDTSVSEPACINCGRPAVTKTPTGFPACSQCFPDGANPADVLDDLSAFVARYIRFSTDHQLVGVVLWAAHTHLAHRLRTTPYLHLTSPEPESGKSQLLDVLEMVVFNPWVVVMPSPAVLYRKIDKAQEDGGLTLLLDEVDPIFRRGGDDAAEALRAVLNSGYQKGRMVPRCVGPSQKLVDFAVYGPKALAGLGAVPDTIASRSIRIAMKRRKPSEKVEPLFPDEITGESEGLRSELEKRVTNLDLGYLRAVRRELLALGLGDRAADGWSSLVAIADAAGGVWPKWARASAAALSQRSTPDSASLGLQLLADVREVWEGDRMFSSDLRDKLIALDEAPWGDYFGKPITQHKMGRFLSGFEVRSRKIRVGDDTRQGYRIEELEDAWTRYTPNQSGTRNSAGQSDISDDGPTDVPLSESPKTPTSSSDVPLVPLSRGGKAV